MKKTILAITLLLFQVIICIGQESNLNSINAENYTIKSCRNEVENKDIGLSNITSDTLTFQQFRQCDKITNKSLFGQEITSYKISYIHQNGTDLIEKAIYNEKLSKELIQSVIESGTNRIIFSEVTGTTGSENVIFGYRSFYLK